MSPPGKRKLSVYFPDFVLRELQEEAVRLDRPLSWLIHRAWRIGYPQIVADRRSKEEVARRRETEPAARRV